MSYVEETVTLPKHQYDREMSWLDGAIDQNNVRADFVRMVDEWDSFLPGDAGIYQVRRLASYVNRFVVHGEMTMDEAVGKSKVDTITKFDIKGWR